jgi:hypothetical protein
MEQTKSNTIDAAANIKWFAGLALATFAWIAAYANLTPFADGMVRLLSVDPQTYFGERAMRFLHDRRSITLLTGVCSSWARSIPIYPPTHAHLLSGKRLGLGNTMAAVSDRAPSVPASPYAVHRFFQAGVHSGVTFSFLISAPMVNEVALRALRHVRMESGRPLPDDGSSVAIVSAWLSASSAWSTNWRTGCARSSRAARRPRPKTPSPGPSESRRVSPT